MSQLTQLSAVLPVYLAQSTTIAKQAKEKLIFLLPSMIRVETRHGTSLLQYLDRFFFPSGLITHFLEQTEFDLFV